MIIISKEEFEARKTFNEIYGSVSTLFEKEENKKGLWHHFFDCKTKKMLGIVVYDFSKENIEKCKKEAEESNKIFEANKNYKKEIEKTERELKKEILDCGSDIDKIHELLKKAGKKHLIGCSSVKSGKYGDYVDFCNFYGKKNILIDF